MASKWLPFLRSPALPAAAVAKIRAVAALAGALAAGCGGAEPRALRPVPDRHTRATLVGPLCDGAEVQCTCREPGQDAGAPGPGRKRYEVRLGPSGDELWATLDDMVLYKSAERAEECFYVDLAPGKHPLRLHARGQPGFAARLVVAEQAPQAPQDAQDAWGEPAAPGWYDTFVFDCDTPDHCAMRDLDEWHAWVQSRRGKIHDPCGSTKVRDLRWVTGRVPDRQHPDALQLDLVLDVYEFTPARGPGDPACAGASAGAAPGR